VRKTNQDSYLDNTQLGLWVVADGMGGHAAGEIASQLITDTLQNVSHPGDLNQFICVVEQALVDVNQQLLDFSVAELDNRTVGSTVISLVAHEDHCAILWAGDSRIYRLRGEQLEMLMQEHTQAEELVAQGLLSAEDAESHPTFNILTRAVGAQDPLYIDIDVFAVQKGDRFLLCSDGLNKAVSDSEIRTTLLENSVEQSVDLLVEQALEQGSNDNVTVVVIEAE